MDKGISNSDNEVVGEYFAVVFVPRKSRGQFLAMDGLMQRSTGCARAALLITKWNTLGNHLE